MLRGLIDIGSNTIKAFLYDVDDGKCITVASTRNYVHLYSFIYDSMLSKEGTSLLLNAVGECQNFLNSHGCRNVHAFATAALRDASNGYDVVNYLRKECTLPVELLSGEGEALCDMLSMKYHSGIEEGVGMDIGGGSGQIFMYDKSGLTKCISLPIGALKVKDMFVEGDFPNQHEEKEICSYINDQLSHFGMMNVDKIYLMGGSGTEILKLFPIILNKNVINRATLPEFYDKLTAKNDLLSFLREHAYGREFTIMPAALILMAVIDYSGADCFCVLENGVREGYLIKNNFFI